MTTRLRCALLLQRLLLLLLHLIVKSTHLLTVRVAHVERGLLRLHVLRLLILRSIKPGLLRLLVLVVSIRVLEPCLLGLETSWLRVGVVEIACALWLLLVDRVSKPVNCALLLISLVPSCSLGLTGLGWCVIE